MADILISKRTAKITDSDARTFRITLTPELIDMGFDPVENYPDDVLAVTLFKDEKGLMKIVIEKAKQ